MEFLGCADVPRAWAHRCATFQLFLSIQILAHQFLLASSHEKLISRIGAQLTKKARETNAPPRCDGANRCSNDGGAIASVEEGVPQVMANMSMDSVDSTVDLSYASADTMDANTSTDSAASTPNAEVEDIGKAAPSDAQKQQQRRRLIAAASASSGGANGTTISTHTHVTTDHAFQAWSPEGRSKRTTAVASTCIAKEEVHTHRQHQEQQRSGKRLICLISNGVADRVQAHRQLHALNILNVRQTPYEAVDGMDPAQRQRRDELFRISDIRGNYPQFFVERQVDNGYGGTKTKVEFWGSY